MTSRTPRTTTTTDPPAALPYGGTIVVGVDGSEPAERAVRWAVAEARRRHATLRVVHVYRPNRGLPFLPGGEALLREYAEGTLADVLEEVDRAGADVLVESQVLGAGQPADALLEAAEGAVMLVVGARGLGGFTGLLLGSVSSACASRAACPVVVVR